ncbi:MAG: hypothetical protein HRT35_25170 [Algicola sp.]|nr:hypothetical protein [Algicola sp.]
MSKNGNIQGITFSLLYLLCFTQAQATTYLDTEVQQDWLGRGIQSTSGLTKQTCVTGDWVERGNTSIAIKYQGSKTAMQSLNEMSGSVKGSVNLGLFAGSVSVSMHTRLEENENTASVVYRISYEGSDLSLENRTYTTLGNSMIGQSASAIQEVCGDEFIDHMQLGSELYLVAQMVFASKEEYEEYVTKVKVRVLFWTSTTTIKDEFYQYAQNGIYSLKVLSTSPLPAPISAIIGASGRKYCTTAAIADCVTAANDIIAYLFDDTGYQSYLRDNENLGITQYHSSVYESSGHYQYPAVQLVSVVGILALQTQLMDALSDNLFKQNIAEAYSANLGPDRSSYLTLLAQIDSNIALLEGALDACRANPTVASCQGIVDTAIAQLVTIDIGNG